MSVKVRFIRDHLDGHGWLVHAKGQVSTVPESVAFPWMQKKLVEPAYGRSDWEEFRQENKTQYILFNLRAITLHLGVLLYGASAQTDNAP